jgi:hypothetical protein
LNQLLHQDYQVPNLELWVIGYIAAMVAGEGSIILRRQGKQGYATRLEISNDDRGVLEWIQSQLHIGEIYLSGQKGPRRSGTGYRWTIGARIPVVRITEMLLPYLIIKAKVDSARKLLAWHKANPPIKFNRFEAARVRKTTPTTPSMVEAEMYRFRKTLGLTRRQARSFEQTQEAILRGHR